jgi:hypothetical protein
MFSRGIQSSDSAKRKGGQLKQLGLPRKYAHYLFEPSKRQARLAGVV